MNAMGKVRNFVDNFWTYVVIILFTLAYPFILIIGVIFFMWVGNVLGAMADWALTGDKTWWKDLWT